MYSDNEKKKLIAEIKKTYPDMDKAILDALKEYSADELKSVRDTMKMDGEKLTYKLENSLYELSSPKGSHTLNVKVTDENGTVIYASDNPRRSSTVVQEPDGSFVVSQTDKRNDGSAIHAFNPNEESYVSIVNENDNIAMNVETDGLKLSMKNDASGKVKVVATGDDLDGEDARYEMEFDGKKATITYSEFNEETDAYEQKTVTKTKVTKNGVNISMENYEDPEDSFVARRVDGKIELDEAGTEKVLKKIAKQEYKKELKELKAEYAETHDRDDYKDAKEDLKADYEESLKKIKDQVKEIAEEMEEPAQTIDSKYSQFTEAVQDDKTITPLTPEVSEPQVAVLPDEPEQATPFSDASEPMANVETSNVRIDLISETSPNGDVCQYAKVNGEIHGVMVTKDKTGQIQDVKLYNRGEELDISASKVEICAKHDDRLGNYYVTVLDDKKFGVEYHAPLNGPDKFIVYGLDGHPTQMLSYDKAKISNVNTGHLEDADRNKEIPVYSQVINKGIEGR